MASKQTTQEGEANVLAAIAAMSGSDRDMAEKIHAIVMDVAPDLVPRTWYGMPAYANQDGKVILFFQSKQKFKTRYATLGFMHEAKLDDTSGMWPASYALQTISPANRAEITELVKRAVS